MLPQHGALWGLCLSLNAVNLSEGAQGKVSPAQQAEIYVTAAIALKATLGRRCSFLPVSPFLFYHFLSHALLLLLSHHCHDSCADINA